MPTPEQMIHGPKIRLTPLLKEKLGKRKRLFNPGPYRELVKRLDARAEIQSELRRVDPLDLP